MRLTQFPDIQWLRKQAQNNFQNGKGVNDQPLPQQGWPSVVLNTKSFGAERNGIKGPFSVFLNRSGKSLVKADGKTIELTDNNLCIVNQGDFYDLIIPEGQSTNTFNIHFGEQLYKEVAQYSNYSTDQQLDNPSTDGGLQSRTPTRSTWKTENVHQQIEALNTFYKTGEATLEKEYELLADLLSTMMDNQQHEALRHQRIDSLKLSTKQELLSRISLSLDYIHAHYNESINLDELAAIACLSKYHYLRTFKAIHACTPQQMIAKLRFEKAVSMLIQGNLPVMEIAPSLGFSELAAFTRFFKKMSGQSPSALRKSS